MIHQTEMTSLHKRINNEKARTIITLFRYNEMRECEDIHLIQIWIALEDFTSYRTSFPTSYNKSNHLALVRTMQADSSQPSLLLTTVLLCRPVTVTTYYVVDRPTKQCCSTHHVLRTVLSSIHPVYPSKHTLSVRFITSSESIVLLQYLLIRMQSPLAQSWVATYIVPVL